MCSLMSTINPSAQTLQVYLTVKLLDLFPACDENQSWPQRVQDFSHV